MKFNELLKMKRSEKKLTQKEVANFLFVSDKTYSQYERGLRNIELETLLRIADFLDIKLSDIDFLTTVDYLYKKIDFQYKSIWENKHETYFHYVNSSLPLRKDVCDAIFPILKYILQTITYYGKPLDTISLKTEIENKCVRLYIENDSINFSSFIKETMIDVNIERENKVTLNEFFLENLNENNLYSKRIRLNAEYSFNGTVLFTLDYTFK